MSGMSIILTSYAKRETVAEPEAQRGPESLPAVPKPSGPPARATPHDSKVSNEGTETYTAGEHDTRMHSVTRFK